MLPEFDLESIIKFIFSGDNGTKEWHIDTIDLGFATLNGIDIKITYTDESIEGLQSVLVTIEDISVAVENANSGVKGVRIFFDHKDDQGYTGHIFVASYYVNGGNDEKLNAIIGFSYNNNDGLIVVAGAFGYDAGIVISPEGELSFMFRIHEYEMQSKPYTGVKADMTLYIKTDCTMTITVNAAVKPSGEDVKDAVQAYANE